MPRYEELYRGRAYAPQAERERLARLLRPGGEPAGPYGAADLRGVGRAGEGPRYPRVVAGPDRPPRAPGGPGEWRDGRPGWAEGESAARAAERAGWRQLAPVTDAGGSTSSGEGGRTAPAPAPAPPVRPARQGSLF